MIQRGFLNKGEAERGNFWDLFHVWDSRNLWTLQRQQKSESENIPFWFSSPLWCSLKLWGVCVCVCVCVCMNVAGSGSSYAFAENTAGEGTKAACLATPLTQSLLLATGPFLTTFAQCCILSFLVQALPTVY
jgi:hypothetical protein